MSRAYSACLKEQLDFFIVVPAIQAKERSLIRDLKLQSLQTLFLAIGLWSGVVINAIPKKSLTD